jgi:hypothetical protein
LADIIIDLVHQNVSFYSFYMTLITSSLITFAWIWVQYKEWIMSDSFVSTEWINEPKKDTMQLNLVRPCSIVTWMSKTFQRKEGSSESSEDDHSSMIHFHY